MPVVAMAAITFFLGIGWFLIWFLAFDGATIHRGDFAYLVFMPSRIRSLPVLAACASPTFSLSTNDNLEAEVIKMEFRSRASGHALLSGYRRALDAWECCATETTVSAPLVTLACEAPRAEIRIIAAEDQDPLGCRAVSLEFRF